MILLPLFLEIFLFFFFFFAIYLSSLFFLRSHLPPFCPFPPHAKKKKNTHEIYINWREKVVHSILLISLLEAWKKKIFFGQWLASFSYLVIFTPPTISPFFSLLFDETPLFGGNNCCQQTRKVRKPPFFKRGFKISRFFFLFF